MASKGTSHATARTDTTVTEAAQKQKLAADRLKERSEIAHQQTEKMAEVGARWQEALAKGDIDTLKIANADFEAASRESAKNRGDITAMMAAVADGYKDIGVAIKVVEQFDDQEKKLQADAAATLAKAEGQLVQAQAKQSNFMGWRDKAIAEATSAITTAKEAVVLARQQAEATRRQRLNSMDLTQSLQFQQSIMRELTDVAQARISEIEVNHALVQQNLTDTMVAITADTEQLEKYDRDLNDRNAELRNLSEELASYLENSVEWQSCRNRILDKERVRNDVEAMRNASFMRAQEGQRFVEFNKIEEQAQVQLLSQHKVWISILQMGSRQRDILIGVHLGLLQGAADQEAMAIVDQVATDTDERLVVDAAMKTQAMRANTLARLGRMPEQVRRLRQITGTEVENQVAFERQFTAAIDEFHRNFGTAAGYDDRDAHRTPAVPPSA